MKTSALIYLVAGCLCALNCAAAEITLTADFAPVKIDAPSSAGLSGVYVVRSSQGLVATYRPDNSAAQVKWFEFGADGAASAREVATGLEFRPDADAGYYAEENGKRTYIWITDYSKSPFTQGALTVADADCSSATLSFDGNAAPLHYRAINGRLIEIDRGLTLSYFTLAAQENAFAQQEVERNLASAGSAIAVPSPLCSTRFTLSGDRFLKAWGEEIACESGIFTPVAVEGIATAEQTMRDAANEQKTTDTAFGGSAPVDMSFRAAVSDAAVFTEWQIARDAEFEDVVMREQSLEFDYSFTETATSFVRFVCANAAGDCEWQSDVFTVSVGESRLRCPNAFSPGASEGVNDEWKVSYRSIISFECYIFNTLGVRMAELHSPDQGWDGRYKGKLVKPGVYYYIIKAVGADGKRYNLSGDINIVGSR